MHDRDLRRIGGIGAHRTTPPAAASEHPLIALQRLAGNAAVAGLVGPPSIQRIWPFDDDEEDGEEAEPAEDEDEEPEEEESEDGEEVPEVYPPGIAVWTGRAGPGRADMVGWPASGGSVSDLIAFAEASAIVHQVAIQYPDEPIPEDVTEGGSGELVFWWPGVGPVLPAGDTRDAVATDAMRFRSGGASPGIERIMLAPGAPDGESPGPGGGGSAPGGGGVPGGGGGVPGGGIPGLEPVPGGAAGPAPGTAPGTAPGGPSSGGGIPGLEPVPGGGGPGIEPVIPGQAPGRPMLHVGSIGDAVREMQALLVRHGASIDPDGSFGRLTQLAVSEFQRRAGLAADGVVGPQTWGALEAG